MIVFTIIGLLWFWAVCFQIGYCLIPALHFARAEVAVWLFGREAERLMAIFAARGVPGTFNDQGTSTL